MAAPTALLEALGGARSTPDNAQGEYYLTDIVAMARRAKACRSVAHVAADERDVLGINDRAQLAAVERIVQRRRADALMRGGRDASPIRRASTSAARSPAGATCASTSAACSKAT